MPGTSRPIEEVEIRPTDPAGLDGDDYLTGFHRAEIDAFGTEISGPVEAERKDGHGATIGPGRRRWRPAGRSHLKCFARTTMTTGSGIVLRWE
jgi:hypothetical protein